MQTHKLLPYAAAVLLAACAPVKIPGGATAVAKLEPTTGSSVAGTVFFLQDGDRVLVSGEVHGLRPDSVHGFHIHEKGDCSAPDGTSAGAHFNPLAKPHAHPTVADRHAGDLPMLEADASGNATLTATIDVITIGSAATDIVGRGVIVHKDPDDWKTQPTGNSGARIACGVIARS
jgi:Cu-Zn family superoxide dismutase